MSDRTERITPDDIEAKFAELADNVDNATSGARDTAKKLSIAGLVMLIIMVYLLGRRRGASGRTVVEVRRV